MIQARLSRRKSPWWQKRKTLDTVNEKLAEKGRHLHPTKGYRTLTIKRLRAAIITGEMKQGIPWPFKSIKMALAEAEKHDRAA